MNKHLRRVLSAVLVFPVLAALALGATTAMGAPAKPAKTEGAKPDAPAVIDSKLVGVWGFDERGGYEFRADGTFIMEGAVTYRFTAAGGSWSYWPPKTPAAKVTAEYKLSADGKSLSINLRQGTAMTNLKRIK